MLACRCTIHFGGDYEEQSLSQISQLTRWSWKRLWTPSKRESELTKRLRDLLSHDRMRLNFLKCALVCASTDPLGGRGARGEDVLEVDVRAGVVFEFGALTLGAGSTGLISELDGGGGGGRGRRAIVDFCRDGKQRISKPKRMEWNKR